MDGAITKGVTLYSQNGRQAFRLIVIDCVGDCDEKYFVVNLAQSKLPPMGRDRRRIIETSKQVGRRFAETTDGFFTCPKCND